MGILNKLSNIFSSPGSSSERNYWIAVKCNRCGEIIKARIDLSNDLSPVYDESGQGTTYFCRKILIGEEHCFHRVEIELTFDANRRMIHQEISGGRFVDKENDPK